MTHTHEQLYTRTVDAIVHNVERNEFSEHAIPRIISDLRSELAQCIDLGLISEEFYRQKMLTLARVIHVLE